MTKIGILQFWSIFDACKLVSSLFCLRFRWQSSIRDGIFFVWSLLLYFLSFLIKQISCTFKIFSAFNFAYARTNLSFCEYQYYQYQILNYRRQAVNLTLFRYRTNFSDREKNKKNTQLANVKVKDFLMVKKLLLHL